jgi:hypothetical protein
MHALMRPFLAAALCASVLAAAPARGAEFRFKDNAFGSSNLELRGSIEPGDFQRLQEVVRRHPAQAYQSFALEIDSPGGDVLDAIRIAEFARDMFWAVVVKGPCASACFFVYAAAPMRSVGEEGSVGLHRPHFDRQLLVHSLPEQARKRTNEVGDTVRAFLARNEVPAWVAELMFSRSADEVTWLTEWQLHALGDRAPYAHELIVARCGRPESFSLEDERLFVACLADIGAAARLPIVHRLIKGTPQWGAFAAEVRRSAARANLPEGPGSGRR